jgi:hypothetical protein
MFHFFQLPLHDIDLTLQLLFIGVSRSRKLRHSERCTQQQRADSLFALQTGASSLPFLLSSNREPRERNVRRHHPTPFHHNLLRNTVQKLSARLVLISPSSRRNLCEVDECRMTVAAMTTIFRRGVAHATLKKAANAAVLRARIQSG